VVVLKRWAAEARVAVTSILNKLTELVRRRRRRGKELKEER